MRITIILASILALAACEEPDTKTQSVQPNYELLAECERPERPGLASIYEDSLCGTIDVWEDRDAGAGRKISLNVMLIKARTPNPKPDPVFFFAGGPGQAATDMGPTLFSRLDDLRREREVVLVDQRGTGKSNPLGCDIDEDDLDTMATIEDIAKVQVAAMRECLESWDANPALYTTPVAMDDLDEVRQRLGYKEINLYGISYGTRASLVYLKRHEDSVRSLILDGVVPMTMPIPDQVAVDAQVAFDQMIADCEEDESCNAAFPNLGATFAELMTRLSESPTDIEVEHPRNGKSFTTRLEAKLVTRLIRSIMYDRELTALLPLAITEAHKGNFKPLVTLSFAFTGGRTQGQIMSFGMMTSVLCSEDMTITSGPNDTEDFDNAVYYGIAPLCEFWPKGNIPADYFEPVSSDKPALLVSGMQDPITPPKYAFEAEKSLPNSTHVLAKGVGHVVTYHGCLPQLMATFLDELNPATLDTSCAAKFKRPAFFTSFAGTASPGEKE